MDYRTKRYKEGLEGKKPGMFYVDEKAHKAQAAGYRDHLKNEDLAYKLQRSSATHEKDDFDYSVLERHYDPLGAGWLLLWAVVLLVPGIGLAATVVNDLTGPHPMRLQSQAPGIIFSVMFCWPGPAGIMRASRSASP